MPSFKDIATLGASALASLKEDVTVFGVGITEATKDQEFEIMVLGISSPDGKQYLDFTLYNDRSKWMVYPSLCEFDQNGDPVVELTEPSQKRHIGTVDQDVTRALREARNGTATSQSWTITNTGEEEERTWKANWTGSSK